MSLGTHTTNSTLVAPGYGTQNLIATMYGFGMNIISSEGESRAGRTFYPKVKTSGSWYVEYQFRNSAERDQFLLWIARYWNIVANPHNQMLLPMTASIPSMKFSKVGYPVGQLIFDDEMGKHVWVVEMEFMSASDPEITGNIASKYRPPINGVASQYFYPSGTQDSNWEFYADWWEEESTIGGPGGWRPYSPGSAV